MTITTLNEYINDGYTLPTVLDEATQTLVRDWFGTRYINEDKFSIYFERECNYAFPRYQQLLRIDPIVSEYDWFVEYYREHKTVTTGGGSDVSTGKTTSSGTSNNTGNTTQNTTQSGTTGSQVDVTQNTEGSGTDTLTHNTTVNDTNSGSSTTDKATSSKSSTINSEATAHDGVSRTVPMSAEYTKTDDSGTSTITLGDETLNIQLHGGMVSPQITNPTTSDQTRDASNGGRLSNGSGTDKTTGTNSGEAEHKTTGTETTGKTSTGKTTTGTTGSGTSSNTGKITTDVTGSGSTSGETQTDGTVTHSTNGTTKSQETGRGKTPAEIITEAARAIRSTSAWIWLAEELDKCFIQSYLVSDDDFDFTMEVE